MRHQKTARPRTCWSVTTRLPEAGTFVKLKRFFIPEYSAVSSGVIHSLDKPAKTSLTRTAPAHLAMSIELLPVSSSCKPRATSSSGQEQSRTEWQILNQSIDARWLAGGGFGNSAKLKAQDGYVGVRRKDAKKPLPSISICGREMKVAVANVADSAGTQTIEVQKICQAIRTTMPRAR